MFIRFDRGSICPDGLTVRRGFARVGIPAAASMALCSLLAGPAAFAHGDPHVIPLVTPASNSIQQGFIRVVNRSNHGGTVRIHAIDDSGRRFGPVSLPLEAKSTVHFNSRDLERGNTSKGLSSGVGDGEGNWRLELDSDLDFEALAYIRTGNGFVTSMHDLVTEDPVGHYRVPFFNPGSNRQQQSRLRLINSGPRASEVTISGLDDEGMPPPQGEVRLTLPAGEARMLTAQQLESGDDDLTGRLGDGAGKWTLLVSADSSILAMNLLRSADGNLANLSRTPYEAHSSEPSDECDDELVVEGDDEDHSSFASAVSLGNLTETATVHAREGTVDGTNDEDGYYRFVLGDTRTIRMELRDLTRNADLYLLNSLGEEVRYRRSRSTNEGTLDESIVWTLAAGTYFIRISSIASGDIAYQIRYSNDSRVPGRRPSPESAFPLGDDGGLDEMKVVDTREGRINATRNETCRFHRAYYRFILGDTHTIRMELRGLTRNADLYLLNSLGEEVSYRRSRSTNKGTLDESIVWTLDAGTYFIQVEAATNSTTDTEYELRYSNDSVVPGRRPSSAFNLYDLTDVTTARTQTGEINATRNETTLFHRNFYRFTLEDTRTVRVELRNLTGNADLYLLNSLGEEVRYRRSRSTNEGTLDESIVWALDAGIYYIQVEAATKSTRTISYQLRYGPGS